jgi:hypothetical protein
MSAIKEGFKGVFKVVRKEILNLAEAALKSGTSNISQQFVNVSENRDENEPPRAQVRTIGTALKSGILDTSKDLITFGLERVMAISPQEQNSEMSEESTWTKQPAEEK